MRPLLEIAEENKMQAGFYTIGYEGAEIGSFIATLVAAGVSLVVDVREVAQSRKPGFSKSSLQRHLAEAGLGYVHVRALGDPKPGRDAARSGDYHRFRQIFTSHLRTDIAKAALSETVDLLKNDIACLLCFENDHSVCHRAIVAEKLAGTTGARVQHLQVPRAAAVGRTGNNKDDCGLWRDRSRRAREGTAAC